MIAHHQRQLRVLGTQLWLQQSASLRQAPPDDAQSPDCLWVYRETRRAKERGLVDLSNTLFAELEKRGGYELVHRSGSF
jgi:hypothetical protein